MIKDKRFVKPFNNTLHKSISRIYTIALHDIPSSESEKIKEVRKSARYIIRWCIKHGADIPEANS